MLGRVRHVRVLDVCVRPTLGFHGSVPQWPGTDAITNMQWLRHVRVVILRGERWAQATPRACSH